MGENSPPEREGPLAQGVGRPVRPQDDEVDGTLQIRETRTPNSAIEEPAQGGASVMGEETLAASTNEKAEDDKHSGRSNKVARRKSSGVSTPVSTAPRIPPSGTPFESTMPTQEQLLLSGSNTSTMAGANFESVLNNRIRTSTDPSYSSSRRSIPELAHRLARAKIVQFESKDEQKAVENLLREHHSRKWTIKDQQRADKGLGTDPYFRPLPKSVRNSLVQSVVKGVYDSEGILNGGAQKHKQPVLNEIAKMTMMNGTYLSGDGERFLRKVQSLLPAAVQAGQQRRGGAGQGKQQQPKQVSK